jgi:hypothetical protein
MQRMHVVAQVDNIAAPQHLSNGCFANPVVVIPEDRNAQVLWAKLTQ